MRAYKERDPAEIFKEVLSENPSLSIDDLVEICSKPQRTVSKWFAGESAPDRASLFLIHSSLTNARMRIPRELHRFYCAFIGKTKRWADKNRTGNSKAVFVGDYVDVLRYVYKSKLLSVAEISAASGKSMDAIYKRVREGNISVGEDITSSVDSIRPRRKKGA